MNIAGWDAKYRSAAWLPDDAEAQPTPLLPETLAQVQPGCAIDLACGTGRNALWLAKRGWQVTAVDGARTAIELLQDRAKDLAIETQVADLDSPAFTIEPNVWDLVTILFYLQRDLYTRAKEAVKPGGLFIGIAHIIEGNEEATQHRLAFGELKTYFENWDLLHSYEGKSRDGAHRRAVAEIVARKPLS